ncbi:MAG TPA: protease modulator HflC [Kiritimatiellia bacterium]|nr:protease modulator HflC [Kiritimatiellia bacterium]
MKSRVTMLLFGLAIVLVFIFTQIMFTVREGEAVVVTTFGKPVKAIDEAGLYRRQPWPIQEIHRFDNRIRILEGAFEEALTRDGKNVLIQIYAGWNIMDPVLFLERVGGSRQAGSNLDGLLRTHKNASVGAFRFSELINVDENELKLAEIESRVLNAVHTEARERYGIEVHVVGIRRIGLPEAITQSVFERMRAERQELADRYRSQGEGEAIRIRARADSERDQLLAGAEAQARILRAEGDAAAAEHYRVFEQNPDLAIFLRKLDTMKDMLNAKSTLVLSSDSEPFDLLRHGPGNQTK